MSSRNWWIAGMLSLACGVAGCSGGDDDDATEGNGGDGSAAGCEELASASEVSSIVDRPDLAVHVDSFGSGTTCQYYPQNLSYSSAVVVFNYDECSDPEGWLTLDRESTESQGYPTEDLAGVGDAAYTSENLASAVKGTTCVTASSPIVPIESTVELLKLVVSRL